MQKLINAVAKDYIESSNGRGELQKYLDLQKSPGWKVHQSILVMLGNLLSSEVLTKQFQKLDSNEKLVRLEAYSNVAEVISFLLNPMPTLNNIAKIVRHNKQMQATTTGASERS